MERPEDYENPGSVPTAIITFPFINITSNFISIPKLKNVYDSRKLDADDLDDQNYLDPTVK